MHALLGAVGGALAGVLALMARWNVRRMQASVAEDL